jgi:hypothetical protein
MDISEIKQRLEPALRPVEKPTLEEVLEEVSTRGVLRGPVDWVFPAWMLYVEYATQEIMKTFPLSEEEKKQLLDFRDAMKRLLREAWMHTKEKLTALHKAVAEGTYSLEGNKLYTPDGIWIYVNERAAPSIPIHDLSAKTYFPDILKLPHERLELLQLGWRASDEGMERVGRPVMSTAQPWQTFAWAAVRYGKLLLYVESVNLTREGTSVLMRAIAGSWWQRWSKDEAIDLVASHLRRGEWTPLLTMWLGDGVASRNQIWRSRYQIGIVAKEPWRLGIKIGRSLALVATGKEAFVRLREAAGAYGALLNVLKSHKWIYIMLATDDNLRAAYKLKMKKRSIDRLRETYRQNNCETPTISHAKRNKPGTVVVVGIMMHLHITGSKGGSLTAQYYTSDVGKALAIADKLNAFGLRPNVVKSSRNYVIYITTADLVRLAERDQAIRKAIALYLAEKAKNGTPRQKEIAEKVLKRNPLFQLMRFYETKATMSRPKLN